MLRTALLCTTVLLIANTTSIAQDGNTVWLPGLAGAGGNLGRALAAGDLNGA